MSLYDTIENYFQIKCTINPSLKNHNIGDRIELPDGAYLTNEGIFIVNKKRVKCCSNKVFTKWGEQIDIAKVVEDYNPVAKTIKDLKSDS